MAKKVIYKGIDISKWQGTVDFGKVTKDKNVDFVILRAGLGKVASQIDAKFNTYYAGAKAAGIPVGAYWYSYAKTVADAKLEAQACLQVIRGKQFEMPIWYDIEEKNTFATGKNNVSAIARAFCSVLEAAGYFVGIYMSRSPATSYLASDIPTRYAMWIAEYSSSCKYQQNYGMWQYSDKGVISGIKGSVDLDYCYVDYISAIKSKGLNGFPKPVVVTPAPTPTPTPTPVVEPDPVPGDVNGNGIVDADDANQILEEYLDTTIAGKKSKLTAKQKKAADINKDGKIDADDANQALVQYLDESVMGKTKKKK